jgi:tRNA G18 (ribose-2'-O)-methylase SpoU
MTEIITDLKQREFRVLGTSARGETGIGNIRLSGKLCLIIGNETRGMSAALGEAADKVLSIPMEGEVTSINIACAASIFLYQMSAGNND